MTTLRATACLALLLGCAPAKVGAPADTSAPGPDDSPVLGEDTGDSSVDGDDTGGAGGEDSAAEDDEAEDLPDYNWEPEVADPTELPDGVRTVNIEIDAAAMDRLDADPYHAPDERGVFVDEDGVEHEVDLCYRGAYALLSVMTYYDLRNWKVKFDADDPYMDRREWNFNYEPHFRAQMAYDLFRFAGVAVPKAEHVVLQVNGVYAGVYLQYEDPDNKSWLQDRFGNNDGDLYKAAYDLPGETQCFGDLTWLGDSDDDYVCHYTKMTNDEDAPEDVAVLRAFLDDLNHLSDEEFMAWAEDAIDIDRLLSYLVVSNFIANWDSYPQRPKNYWLYEDQLAGRVVYIPWDLDGTFSPSIDSTYNKMGTTAPVLYNLIESDYAPVHSSEGRERPLVRRLFANDEVVEAYLDRYRELSETILSKDYLDDRLTSLGDMLEPEASSTDRTRMSSAEGSMRTFITQRTTRVESELAGMR